MIRDPESEEIYSGSRIRGVTKAPDHGSRIRISNIACKTFHGVQKSVWDENKKFKNMWTNRFLVCWLEPGPLPHCPAGYATIPSCLVWN
jgi:hypothetical protein